MEQDEFGVYKKAGVNIPFRFKREYERLKDSREYHIYKRYCGLSRFAIYKRKNESYMDYIIHKPSKEVKDKIQNLINKG